MKLIDLLNKPAFHDIEILAGKNGLGREIKNVTMMDAPDIIDFLFENDFLVTTAYHLKEDPALLLGLVQSMHKQKCAGLGIKTHRFLESIPEEVIQYADTHQFPVLQIPLEKSLGEIVNTTLQYMLNERTSDLLTAFETHRKFTQHILKGKGIKKLLDDLSNMIGQRVILLDQHFQIHASSHSKHPISEMIMNLYAEDFRLFLNSTSCTCFSSRYTEEVFAAFPIHTPIGKPAFLIALGSLPIHDKNLLLTIEQATNVLTFELMRENTERQYARRARNEFFLNIVEGRITSKEEITSRAKEFSLTNELPSLMILGKVDQSNVHKTFAQHQLETDYLYEFLETEIIKAPFLTQLFVKGDHCILIMEAGDSNVEFRSQAIDYLKDLQGNIEKIFKKTMSFGLSNISHQLVNMQNAYKEALSAYHTGLLSAKSQFIQVHRPKDVSEMLRIIPEKDLQEFCDHIFQGLSNKQQEEDAQILLHTLSVYLETHCQISETAKRLFVHRNTVIYRLEKCEELLGRSLKDADTTFHLRLAFRIKSILQVQQPTAGVK